MDVSNQVMDLHAPSEEHVLLRQTVRDFVSREVEPQAEEYDQKAALNRALLRKCGDLGLLGVTVPEDAGGAGLDAFSSSTTSTTRERPSSASATCLRRSRASGSGRWR